MQQWILMVLSLTACSRLSPPPPTVPSAALTCPESVTKPAVAQPETRVVRSLQRQLTARERRIAELETQLSALKLIDRPVEKTKQSMVLSPQ